MSIKDQLVTVPQIIRDECPLPDGYVFREETNNHWARLYYVPLGDGVWWISRDYDTGKFTLNSWTGKYSIKIEMPPETTHEELWRYVYAQFILGDNNG